MAAHPPDPTLLEKRHPIATMDIHSACRFMGLETFVNEFLVRYIPFPNRLRL